MSTYLRALQAEYQSVNSNMTAFKSVEITSPEHRNFDLALNAEKLNSNSVQTRFVDVLCRVLNGVMWNK